MESTENSPNKENQAEGGISSRQPKFVQDPDTAARIFSQIQVDYGFKVPDDFLANVKILGQIYDTIQKYLEAGNRKSDSAFPDMESLYSDLQLFKRTVSDKAPMPDKANFEMLLYMLAAQHPPFIHVIRELYVNQKGDLAVSNRYAAPTPDKLEFVQLAYKENLLNCTTSIRGFLTRNRQNFSWEKEMHQFSIMDNIDLKQGRVENFLKVLYVRNIPELEMTAGILGHLKAINESIQKRILIPLIQRLVKANLVTALPTNDVRTSGIPGTEKFPDILLIQEESFIQRRFNMVTSILDEKYCRKYQDETSRQVMESRLKNDEMTREEFYLQLSEAMYARYRDQGGIPEKLLEPIVETMKLSGYKAISEKSRQQETEKDDLENILEAVRKQENVFRAKDKGKLFISEKYLKWILKGRVPALLAGTNPADDMSKPGAGDPAIYDNIYLLYKDRKITANAVETSVDLYESTDDTVLLWAVENLLDINRKSDMELKAYVAPMYLERLRHAVKKSYERFLPWYHRIYLILTSSEMSESTSQQLAFKLRKRDEAILKTRRKVTDTEEIKQGKKQVRKLAKERLKDKEAEEKSPDRKADPRRSQQIPDEVIVKKILEYLDKAWARGMFPRKENITNPFKPELHEKVVSVLNLVDVGGASVKSIRAIDTGDGRIYVGEAYIKENQEEILQRCQAKLKKTEDIVVNNKTMQRKVDTKDSNIYEGIAHYIRNQI